MKRGSSLQRRHLLQRDGVDPVELTGGERIDAALVDGQESERHRIEVRQALFEVIGVLLDRDVVALHPFDEFERTGADRFTSRIAAFDRLLVDDLAIGGEVGQEGTEGRLQVEDHGLPDRAPRPKPICA